MSRGSSFFAIFASYQSGILKSCCQLFQTFPGLHGLDNLSTLCLMSNGLTEGPEPGDLDQGMEIRAKECVEGVESGRLEAVGK